MLPRRFKDSFFTFESTNTTSEAIIERCIARKDVLKLEKNEGLLEILTKYLKETCKGDKPKSATPPSSRALNGSF